ncbi:hypothetical protein K9N50_01545 [bacterium]|nr:hypothetical protein [bacterium]
MAELNISQTEADILIAMEKIRADLDVYEYPGLGGKVIIPLLSRDQKIDFLLDIERGRINLLKGKYQNRTHRAIILVRIDFGGAPHRNPDGEEITCPHLHLYREGFGDKWAFQIPISKFPNINDPWDCLFDFMKYCNITEQPTILSGLFR